MDAMLGELGLGEGKLASTLEEEQAQVEAEVEGLPPVPGD